MRSLLQRSDGALNFSPTGGLRVPHRQVEGYPEVLVAQIVRNSYGLQMMAGVLLAMLTGSQATASKMSKIQPAFVDCLPELVRG